MTSLGQTSVDYLPASHGISSVAGAGRCDHELVSLLGLDAPYLHGHPLGGAGALDVLDRPSLVIDLIECLACRKRPQADCEDVDAVQAAQEPSNLTFNRKIRAFSSPVHRHSMSCDHRDQFTR